MLVDCRRLYTKQTMSAHALDAFLEPRRANKSTMAKSLLQYQYDAERSGDSRVAATLSYVLRETHPDPVGHDPWLLPLLLVPFLVQYYLRRWEFALVSVLIFYFVESTAWVLLMKWKGVARNLLVVEHRNHSLVVDPFVAVFGILLASYVNHLFDLTAASAELSATFLLQVGAIAVTVSLAGFRRLYYASFLVLTLLIWLVHTINEQPDTLGTHLVAFVSAFAFYAWFLAPIHSSYLYNAAYAIPYYALIVSVLFGLGLAI